MICLCMSNDTQKSVNESRNQWKNKAIKTNLYSATFYKWIKSAEKPDCYYNSQYGRYRLTGALITMGQGGHVPQYLWRGEMSPSNILEVMSFRMTRVTATVVCCILMQILCVVWQKSFSFWGTLSPRHPTGALPLDPAGVITLHYIT